MINKIFELLAKVKVCYGNAGFYISVTNFTLLLLSVKQLYNININPLLLILSGILGLILLGYMDYRFVLRNQSQYLNAKNTLKEQLDRIEKKLNE